MLVNYQPFEATYLKVVNWCEIQHEDKNGVLNTYTFTNLIDTFNFITKPEYKDFIVMAHCGGCFDFQSCVKAIKRSLS